MIPGLRIDLVFLTVKIGGILMIDNEYIRAVVESIISDKEMRNVVPASATLTDVLSAVRKDALEGLRSLCRSKEIVVNKTLNGFSFRRP